MKRKALVRGLWGFPGGIAIVTGITIIISLGIGDGAYHPCDPAFVAAVGNEITAVIIQTVLSGILGCIYGAASVIWEMADWSLPKQSAVFCVILTVPMMAGGYIMRWMEHSVSGILSFFLIFFAVFIIIWVVNYLGWMIKIRKLNQDVERRNKKE